MTGFTEAYDYRGRTLVDNDGDKIGTVEEVYTDSEGGQPEWALVHTGLFGTKNSFVPLRGASPNGENIRVAVTKQAVKDSPGVDADQQLSEEEERRLFDHYGVPYSSEGTTTARGVAGEQTDGDEAAVGRDVSGPTTDDAMTRSEEELHVGTREHEVGRARLRKYVVTENVTQTVPVRREEVRVEREPITDANVDDAMAGPEISEEEHEVVLHEEEPVVEKRAVPKERVRLDTETATEERQVSEEVRKERIDVDDARS
jgi:uncharacterized protein (TIGR02271 family)